MNVEIGVEAAPFPEKEYIRGIFVAVCVSIVYFSYNLFTDMCSAYFFWFNTVKTINLKKDIAWRSRAGQLDIVVPIPGERQAAAHLPFSQLLHIYLHAFEKSRVAAPKNRQPT
jgi:hypothetical protein